MADTTYGLGVDMSEVAKTLATFPQLTGEAAEKAVKELTQAFAKADKSAKALLKAQKKAAEEAAKAGNGIKAFGDKAGDADTALKALAGAVGLVSPQAESALSSLGDLLGGAEGASKATALLGVAGTAAAVGVVAVAASVAAFGAAAVGAVGAALDLHESWEDVQGLGGLPSFKLDSDQIDSIADGEAALTSAKLAAEAVVVAFASFVAPAVEAAAKGFTFLVLGTKQVVSAFGDAGQVAVDLGTLYKAYVLTAFDLVAKGAAAVVDGLAAVARFTGADEIADSMNRAADGVRAFSGELKDDAYADASEVLGRMGAAARGVYGETVALTAVSKRHNATVRDSADAADAARAAEEERRTTLAALEADLKRIGDTQRDTNKATSDAASKTQALFEKTKAFAEIAPDAVAETRAEYKALNSEILRQIEANQKAGISTAALEEKRVELARTAKLKIADLERQARDERIAADQAAAQEAADLYRSQQEVVLSAVSSTIGDIGAAFSAYSDLLSGKYQETQDAIASAREAGDEEQTALLEEQNKRRKKGLIALFAAEQAAALAQIAIDTALGFSAVTAAYAANPPLMLGLQALVVTSGIAQAAAVSAARPSFHSGGVVPSSQAGQGEVMSRLLPGEVVLNRQTVDRMGGPASADRLNRGGSGMNQAPIILEQRYGHRVFDEVVYDDLRRPDSSLRKAISGRSRVGHRSR